MLVSGARAKSVDDEKQRMVSVTFKTIGNGGDVNQVIRFYNDKTWYDFLSGDRTIKKIQLHPFA